jgi:hypothetical protein
MLAFSGCPKLGCHDRSWVVGVGQQRGEPFGDDSDEARKSNVEAIDEQLLPWCRRSAG